MLKLTTKLKTMNIVKEELLSSVLEMEDQDDLDLDEAVQNTNDAQEAIMVIKRYEGIL